MSEPCHSLACTDTDPHPAHTWGNGTETWRCLGTDPVAAVNSTRQYTLDGALIRYGMTLVDYDLNECKVTGVQSVNHGTIWFKTTTGMFDASRLWATAPKVEPMMDLLVGGGLSATGAAILGGYYWLIFTGRLR